MGRWWINALLLIPYFGMIYVSCHVAKAFQLDDLIGGGGAVVVLWLFNFVFWASLLHVLGEDV